MAARYRVLEKGFYDSKIYDPNGKRPILTVDKPFKKTPSWLERIKDPTKAELAKEKKVAKTVKKDEEKKAKEDKAEIDSVNFTKPAAAVEKL